MVGLPEITTAALLKIPGLPAEWLDRYKTAGIPEGWRASYGRGQTGLDQYLDILFEMMDPMDMDVMLSVENQMTGDTSRDEFNEEHKDDEEDTGEDDCSKVPGCKILGFYFLFRVHRYVFSILLLQLTSLPLLINFVNSATMNSAASRSSVH